MELTYEETEHYIDQICSGIKFVEVDGVQFLLKQPSLKDRVKARFIYNMEYDKALSDGFVTYDQMKDLIKVRNLITDEDRANALKLKNEIEAQKALLSKTTKVRARQDSIKEIINKKEEELRVIENKERAQYAMTAETKAEEAKVIYLCWLSVYDFYTDVRYWYDYSSFLSEKRYSFRQKIINSFLNFYNGLPTAIIRCIARGSLWRIRYITSVKTSDQLFGIPAAEYTNDMANLAYWSQYYSNIYEMLPEDRPSDNIIDDDAALDAYMDDYYKEKQNEGQARKGKKSHGKLSAYDKEEVIVTRSDPLYEHIEYDKPREAQAIKDKALVNKRTRRG